jgi:beta-lactamase class A
MAADIRDMFDRTGCAGQLCVQSLDGSQEVAVDADELVVSASVFKVSVALEAETQFAAGRLDPRQRVPLLAADRTPGPTGFSLFQDDAEVSLRDLVVAMLTISDNVATDALLDRVGVGAVNAGSARLGLVHTVIAADLRTTINSIGRDAGFGDWAGLGEWTARPHSEEEGAQVERRVRAAGALVASSAIRTTPREMARLLRLIWSDRAGPPQACQRVRQLMGRQLTKHRLAAAFPSPARVAAKSGSMAGVIRNEVGVIEYPDGRGYVAAVFTQAREAQPNGAAIDAAIGAAAAAAVEELRGKHL